MPVWLLLIVMSLAVYRLTRLIVKDDLPPVLWARDRIAGGWRPLSSGELEFFHDHLPQDLGEDYREVDGVLNRYVTRWSWSPRWLADLVSCPWCASGWIAGGLTAGADMTVGMPAPVLMGLAAWAAGALLASKDWA